MLQKNISDRIVPSSTSSFPTVSSLQISLRLRPYRALEYLVSDRIVPSNISSSPTVLCPRTSFCFRPYRAPERLFYFRLYRAPKRLLFLTVLCLQIFHVSDCVVLPTVPCLVSVRTFPPIEPFSRLILSTVSTYFGLRLGPVLVSYWTSSRTRIRPRLESVPDSYWTSSRTRIGLYLGPVLDLVSDPYWTCIGPRVRLVLDCVSDLEFTVGKPN